MKNFLQLLSFICIISLLFSNCSKENDDIIMQLIGDYTGDFVSDLNARGRLVIKVTKVNNERILIESGENNLFESFETDLEQDKDNRLEIVSKKDDEMETFVIFFLESTTKMVVRRNPPNGESFSFFGEES